MQTESQRQQGVAEPLQTQETTAAAPTSLRFISKPIAPEKKGGFFHHWGPQAWIDMVMSYTMLVKKGALVITYTFLPILRMTTDAERIDREWAEIRSRQERVRLFDSPRERWRKNYGNFVRNMEWVLLELRQHFSQEQYEELVLGTMVAIAKENSARFFEMMNGMANTKPPSKSVPSDGPGEPSTLQKMLFSMFNPAGFLTGPAEITEFNPAAGKMTMYVPECAWHICPAQESLPDPHALPEQGCLLICKGLFERIFDGKEGGLVMDFDPHLPETSCTVKMNWKVDQSAAHQT